MYDAIWVAGRDVREHSLLKRLKLAYEFVTESVLACSYPVQLGDQDTVTAVLTVGNPILAVPVYSRLLCYLLAY